MLIYASGGAISTLQLRPWLGCDQVYVFCKRKLQVRKIHQEGLVMRGNEFVESGECMCGRDVVDCADK